MDTQKIYHEMGISSAVLAFCCSAEEKLKPRFAAIDAIAEYNQAKVVAAMQKNRVSAECFATSTGYGYNDIGREALEKVYADTFHTEAALVRPQITCGTHALALALAANLRPGDELYSPVGRPYDTLEEVIGIRPCKGSLAEFGITYRETELLPDGTFDYENIRKSINEKTKLVTIQRSKGYATRPTFSVQQIGELIRFVKELKPGVICMVDNCYGEFTEIIEPSDVGADMIVGSLIKNPGGGLAPTGGYIVGREDLIRRISFRLTAPGIGREEGSYAASYRPYYQGLFMAPHTAVQAVKTSILAAAVFEELGMRSSPTPDARRTDIIQALEFGTPERMVAFCQAIQAASPIDSMAEPEPWDMPGYADQVIMAAGTFVSGASIELSADGPMRAPYAVYLQGGLTYGHGRIALCRALEAMQKKGTL